MSLNKMKTTFKFGGRELSLNPIERSIDVFQPTSSGLRFAFLMLKWDTNGVLPLAGKTVLDLGCGSGFLGAAAEKLGASTVVGSDVNPNTPFAINQINELNEVNILPVVQDGIPDMRSEMHFDVVILNAPIFPAGDDLDGNGLIIKAMQKLQEIGNGHSKLVFHTTDIIDNSAIFSVALRKGYTVRVLTRVTECVSRDEFWKEYQELDCGKYVKLGKMRYRNGLFFLTGNHILVESC